MADLRTLTEGGETLRCELRTTISLQDSWDTEIRGPASERMDYVSGGGGASYRCNTGPAGLAVHVYQELVALAFEQICAGALKRESRTAILSCQQSPSPGKVHGDGIQPAVNNVVNVVGQLGPIHHLASTSLGTVETLMISMQVVKHTTPGGTRDHNARTFQYQVLVDCKMMTDCPIRLGSRT